MKYLIECVYRRSRQFDPKALARDDIVGKLSHAPPADPVPAEPQSAVTDMTNRCDSPHSSSPCSHGRPRLVSHASDASRSSSPRPEQSNPPRFEPDATCTCPVLSTILQRIWAIDAASDVIFHKEAMMRSLTLLARCMRFLRW